MTESPFDRMLASIDQKREAIEKVRTAFEKKRAAEEELRQALAALPPDLASEASAVVGNTDALLSITIEVPHDMANMVAMDCIKQILMENNGGPMHYATIAKEALRRGYRGKKAASGDELESRTVSSFWARMSRCDFLESVGDGNYRLKRPGDATQPAGANKQDSRLPHGRVQKTVLTVANQFDTFTIRDVMNQCDRIGLSASRISIKSALKRLVELGEIEIREQGEKGQPNVYKLTRRKLIDLLDWSPSTEQLEENDPAQS